MILVSTLLYLFKELFFVKKKQDINSATEGLSDSGIFLAKGKYLYKNKSVPIVLLGGS